MTSYCIYFNIIMAKKIKRIKNKIKTRASRWQQGSKHIIKYDAATVQYGRVVLSTYYIISTVCVHYYFVNTMVFIFYDYARRVYTH